MSLQRGRTPSPSQKNVPLFFCCALQHFFFKFVSLGGIKKKAGWRKKEKEKSFAAAISFNGQGGEEKEGREGGGQFMGMKR